MICYVGSKASSATNGASLRADGGVVRTYNIAQLCEASCGEGLEPRKRVREGLAPLLAGAGDSLIDLCR